MREIVFDTETTGLDPNKGHRLVEIGCVELVNRKTTGKTFHAYVNPEREVPRDAFAIHGLSYAFLKDHPRFHTIADEFLAFIGDAPLIAHNAMFDLGFLNVELTRAYKPTIHTTRIVDTLALARRKHKGASNTLDALCVRYGVDNSERRDLHGALYDATILVEVYLHLIGARQGALFEVPASEVSLSPAAPARIRLVPLAPRITAGELMAHQEMVISLGSSAIWNEYNAAERRTPPLLAQELEKSA
jgi:DNA polymerase-3 subunit epsilon